MIHMENASKTYRTDRIETLALANVDLSIENGEFVSIMGPSGCGKSTMLHLLGLLDTPTSGRLALDGEEVGAATEKRRTRLRNEKLGFVFQSFHLVPDLSVQDNVELPLLYRRVSGAERRKLATAALERVGLGSRMHHFPTQLSGGQQQRVAVARALVGRPRLLLADEPTGNLDSATGEEIMSILHSVNREDGTTVVMVTHDERFAKGTDRIVRLFDGRQVA